MQYSARPSNRGPAHAAASAPQHSAQTLRPDWLPRPLDHNDARRPFRSCARVIGWARGCPHRGRLYQEAPRPPPHVRPPRPQRGRLALSLPHAPGARPPARHPARALWQGAPRTAAGAVRRLRGCGRGRLQRRTLGHPQVNVALSKATACVPACSTAFPVWPCMPASIGDSRTCTYCTNTILNYSEFHSLTCQFRSTYLWHHVCVCFAPG